MENQTASRTESVADDDDVDTSVPRNRRQKKPVRAGRPIGTISEAASQTGPGPRPIRPKSAFEQMEDDFSKTGTVSN